MRLSQLCQNPRTRLVESCTATLVPRDSNCGRVDRKPILSLALQSATRNAKTQYHPEIFEPTRPYRAKQNL